MKRILVILTVAMLLCACLPVTAVGETVVTSFYPIWLFTLNLTNGLEDITVSNLAAPTTGCLHDYQLQTADMKALSQADVFLVNGAGMEAFLPEITAAFPELPVVSAATGIPLLAENTAAEVGEAEEEVPNAHLWLDASRAMQMVCNLADGLMAALPEKAEQITGNRDAYLARLQALHNTLKDGLSNLPNRKIVTFHEAFPYFAQAYGLEVAAVVNREPGETLTPAQMARLIQVIGELGTPPLFVEPQYEDLSARTLAAETGAPVYTLDPIVTGPAVNPPLDTYETLMLQNMVTLQQALGKTGE